MRIINEPKYDFDDVLIPPKRSAISSREEVDIVREYKFKNSGKTWSGLPLIASNMDATGTFAMVSSLSPNKIITALHKHYEPKVLAKFLIDNIYNWKNIFYTIGTSDRDVKKLDLVDKLLKDEFRQILKPPQPNDSALIADRLKRFPEMLMIDVANGYQESFVEHVKRMREKYPNTILACGNVVTPEMTEQLILSGADIVKIGIGSGCFVSGTQVLTKHGWKNIEDIVIGDQVYTHRNRLKDVKGTTVREEKEKLICVNGIECTPNHEFYVLNKKYKAIVDDNNIDEYAEWIAASDLTKEYLLLKLKKD